MIAPANFVNIPIVAWLFAPFALLPLKQAEAILLVINILICLSCLVLLLRRFENHNSKTAWLITLTFVTSGPLINALNLGQTSPAILLLLLLIWKSIEQEKFVRAGAWLGLAGLIKIPVLLLIPYFLLRKREKVAITATLFLLGFGLLSVLIYGWPLHVSYFNTVFRANMNASIAAHNSQSIQSFVARVFTNASLWSWQPIILPATLRILQLSLVVLIVMISGWAIFNKREGETMQRTFEIGIVLCVCLAIFPISWVHYGTWLIPVLVITGFALRKLRVPLLLWSLLVLALLLIHFPMPPPHIIQRFDQEMWFRLLISHQLFGTLLLLSICIWCRLKQLNLYENRVRVLSS